MKHIPKKSLGQNFLKNQGIVEKIVAAAELQPNDVVLEIGPGQGALTQSLLTHAGKIIAIEKDDSLFAHLQEIFSKEIAQVRLVLIHGDCLDFDPDQPHPNPLLLGEGTEPYKLVANIPYNITGAIIEKFLSCKAQPSMMVLMVQKEVAERIVAKNKKTGGPGKESILSIAVKAYGNPEYICTVKAGNFVPAPSVDSAVIKISNISRKNFVTKHHEEVFFQIMKAGFAHKRKTLGGNLKNILEPEIVTDVLLQSGIASSVRAEDLGINDWLSLAQFVYNTHYGNE